MFGKNKHTKQSNPKPAEIIALVGEGCLFEGDITLPHSARIEGNVRGNINAKGSLIIGEKGVITGEIKAIEIIVHGKVEKGIIETQRLEIKKGGSVASDVSTKSLIIEDGGTYNGKCFMEQSPAKTETKSTKTEQQPKAQ
jgi:cytoskeletal protein CcmA (bactofilin family)